MKRFKLLMPLLCIGAMLGGCAGTTVRGEAPREITGGRLELSEAPTLARQAETVELFYFSQDGQPILRRADGAELALNADGDKNVRNTFAVLHADGPALYALWQSKLVRAVDGVGRAGDKIVYFRSSLDGGKTLGPLRRVNQKGGAFKPYVASSGKGDVFVAYTDERDNSVEFDLYVNVSHDHGATWKQQDIKVNGTESRASVNPSVVADGDHAYVAWMTRTYAKDFKIFVRVSSDRGETWQAPVAVHASSAQPAMPMLIKTAAGLLLCWGDVDAVRCKDSADHGQTWSAGVAIENSKGTAGLWLAADSKGETQLLFAQKPEGEQARVNLFHVRSADGKVFSKPQRISGGVPHAASTILPTLASGNDGSVLAVWTDMRYLRPVIMANYSSDGGTTWQEKDVVLAGKPGLWHFFPTVAYAGGGTYSVAWQETPDRRATTSVIGQLEFRPGMGVAMPQPDVARLKERVDAFWRLREDAKWAQIFDLLDPFFREGSSAAVYAKSQGAVKYHAHEIVGEPKIDGVRATVQVSYDSEVPEVMLKGKPISVPRAVVEIPQEWIWVDGDWYHVFRDLFGGSALIE